MAKYYIAAFFVLLSLYVSSGHCSQLQTVDGKIHISIGYSSGCFFVQIFMHQVQQTFERYNKYVDMEFIPWGRTMRAPNGSLVCQFGEPDCFANRVQRCALTLLEGDQAAQVRFVLCEFREPFPAFRQRSLACAQAAGLNIQALDFCVSTSFGDSLEGPFQERARLGMDFYNRIPHVVFNGVPVLDHHIDVFHRGLRTVVCEALRNDPTTSVTSCSGDW